MSHFAQRLQNNEKILIDGGTGTELERREVPMTDGAWSSLGALTHPDLLRTIHEDYIRAGAEMIIANTYSCSRHLLEGAGHADKFEELNRVGVEIALQARVNVPTEHHVTVSGSISTTDMFTGQPPIETARRNYRDQAIIQKAAGAEMIALEMMRDIEHTQAALDAVYHVDLPVWCGYSCEIKDGKVKLFDNDHLLEDALKVIQGQPIELVTIMHTLTEDIDACLDVLQANYDGKIGVYAHSGDFVPPNWQFIDAISAENYANACDRWMARGVQVIGGCCGIEPKHIVELKNRMG